ncbi:hypothetical protein GALMADRAFT_451850 [Galerina marginata CBS 339.88]|uniref:Uncharacterized protein n=1 Tax=Galerina marginata (strain CBS 339.88) TaxID=685588 RepID=A0A067T9M0_GALM3|nr:hypothetical protein GALMADRAFT_451850 [Galerina marginata CBS 339.88]
MLVRLAGGCATSSLIIDIRPHKPPPFFLATTSDTNFPVMDVPAQDAMKPWLERVAKRATELWREDLESLCLDAKNRFPDIVWHTSAQLSDDRELQSAVWGHMGTHCERTCHTRFYFKISHPRIGANQS